MGTVRMNITIPEEIAGSIKSIHNKSAFISEAIKYKLEYDKKQKLLKELEEGYKKNNEVDSELSKEWEHTTGEGID